MLAHCRTCHRKIDSEAGDVLAMWMQTPPSASMRPTALRGVKQMLAPLDIPATKFGDSAATRDGTKLGVRIATAFGEGCEHNRPLQQPGCRAISTRKLFGRRPQRAFRPLPGGGMAQRIVLADQAN